MEDAIRGALASDWWMGRDGKTTGVPPARKLRGILRHETIPGLAEEWRARHAPPPEAPRSQPTTRYVPNEGELRAEIGRLAYSHSAHRYRRSDPEKSFLHDGIPPTDEEVERQRLPVELLPVGQGACEAKGPWWVWPRGELTDHVTLAWLSYVANRHAVIQALTRHLQHPDVRRVTDRVLAEVRAQFDDAVDAALDGSTTGAA